MERGTHARDFPLKTTGGATAAKITKPIWTYKKKYDTSTFIHEGIIVKFYKYDINDTRILPSKTERTR